MKLSMISKSLLIALPLLALGACSSKSDTDAAAMEANRAAMARAAAAAGDGSNVDMDRIGGINLSDEELTAQQYATAMLTKVIQFDYDRSEIKPEYTSILDAHAKYLMDNPDKSVTIEGHTDEKGTPEYNIALGEHRAMSVSIYLQNMGVSSRQISLVSFGEEKPANFGHNESAWSDNRRAELVY
ncbi:MAG: peptidoglycan-associated lipoprotein Pal [Psychromonas sp.]